MLTRIKLYLIFLVIPFYAACAECVEYAEYQFHHERDQRLLFHDYTNDGVPDIIVESGRNLHFYEQRMNASVNNEPDMILHIPSPYSFYDFRKSGEREEIALLYPGGIDVIGFSGDGFSSPPQFLASGTISVYAKVNRLHYSDFFQDIDGDGKDDLFLPEADNLCVFFADDLSSPALRIPQMKSFSLFNYDNRKVSSPYHTRFVMWRDHGVGDVIIERKSGQIRLRTKRRTYILSKDKNFIKRDNSASDLNHEDAGYDTGGDSLIYNHIDINGDKKDDHVEIETKDSGFSPKTKVKIYLRNKNGVLSPKPDQILTAGSVMPRWGKAPFEDVDGDGDRDLILLDPDFHGSSVESNLKVFIKRGVSGNLDFYLWNDSSGYPRRPSFSFPIQLKWEFFNYYTPFEDYFHAGRDFTGDDKPDLLVRTDSSEFSLFAFINEQEGFHKKAIQRFKLPGILKRFEILDLNHDGVPDIDFVCRDDSDGNISLDLLFISKHK
ncbi:VCBS repeat-containing protein [Candidatus Sumerlaeota bacterium]|nr:VCBS repeat-containing protein [Candidatus Sumerlaeota bacterium]